ncbi:beta-1,3-glucanase family protein [Streptomyces sp. NPDC089919]|uniref:beta-1,3-glucanase family protein n=1 Tax=Streptomyces sp. NPDC089919 TaxID=3155188 RepID=UPI003445110B
MSIRPTAPSGPARPSRRTLRTAACAALLLAVPVVSIGGAALAHAADAPPAAATGTAPAAPAATNADADQDFTQKVSTDQTGTTWSFGLKDPKPGVDLNWVDVDYVPAGTSQPQGIRMTKGADGTWTTTAPVTGKFTYYFVYQPSDLPGGQKQSGAFDQDGKPVAPPTPPDGKGGFPLNIVDKNAGDYVTVVGQASPKHYSYVTADGTVKPVTDQPGATAADKTMSIKLSDLKKSDAGYTVELPAHFGGRIFVSHEPLHMPAADGGTSDSGYVQYAPTDSNKPVLDFVEYTFENGSVAFGGNTTQVDGFAIPMKLELKQDSSGVDKKVGIENKSTAQVIADYKDFTKDNPAFSSLVGANGITAPRSATGFQPDGTYGKYFDSAIAQAWTGWKKGGTTPFQLTVGNTTYKGDTGSDGTGPLTFTAVGGGSDTFQVKKPSTTDVTGCAGSLADGNDTEKAVEARLCAAFNRGVAQESPATWNDASTYYKKGTTFNAYAAFFHKESLDGKAYGFAYDDVNSQDSLVALPNPDAPTSLTLTVGS